MGSLNISAKTSCVIATVVLAVTATLLWAAPAWAVDVQPGATTALITPEGLTDNRATTIDAASGADEAPETDGQLVQAAVPAIDALHVAEPADEAGQSEKPTETEESNESRFAVDDELSNSSGADQNSPASTVETSSSALQAIDNGTLQSETNSDGPSVHTLADSPEASRAPAAGPLADGLYSIQSLVGAPYVLDVAGASKSSGANVQLYSSNNTDAQKWKLTFLNGYYTIASVASGKVLDVAGARTVNGTNVQQYNANGTDAQLWTIVDLGGGAYAIKSKLDPSFVLDVSGAYAGNGANVQIYKSNNTAAQKWYIGPLGTLTSERLVEDGVYTVSSALGKNLVVDISGGSYNNGTNIQVYSSNNTNAQRWAFTWDEGTQTYSIRNAANAKALDVYDGSIGSGANVHEYEWNGSNAQRWVIQKNGNRFVLRNVIAGLALDVSGASTRAGANVQVYMPNATAAQGWVLTKTDGVIVDGIYNIYTMLAPAAQAIEAVQSSEAAGAPVQTNQAGVSFEQKFKLAHIAGDVYTIQSVVSGKFLSAAGDTVVQADQSSGEAHQWTVVYDADGLRISDTANPGLSMKVASNSPKSGTGLVLAANERAKNQLYRFQVVNLISDGYYLVRNVDSGKVLDISAGSYSQQANVQQYSANGSGAQTFLITAEGDSYRIMNARSHKVLDVTGGSKSAGANVQQYGWNGTGAQLWSVELGDNGQVVFKNKNSGLVLEVANASTADGANVRQNTAAANKKGQLWKLEPTKKYSLSGDDVLDGYIADILGNHPDLYSAYRYVSDFTYRKGNEFWGGDKYLPDSTTISYAKEMVEHWSGNCYRFSSLFSWLARGLGYGSNVVSGWVAGIGAPQAPHGWVEVYQNGAYICDPDMYNANRGYNWYMQTYSSAPIAYHFW